MTEIKSLNYLKTKILCLLKSESQEYLGEEKSEQKFEKTIGENVKLRKQKSDELNKMKQIMNN